MTDPLTRDELALGLSEVWTDHAKALEVLDPEDRAARALRRCADELRQVIQTHAPDWISHAQVRLRTGRSDSYLYTVYRQLAAEGRARKGSRGWEVAREAAAAIPVRRGHDPLQETEDLDELAELLADRARAAS